MYYFVFELGILSMIKIAPKLKKKLYLYILKLQKLKMLDFFKKNCSI